MRLRHALAAIYTYLRTPCLLAGLLGAALNILTITLMGQIGGRRCLKGGQRFSSASRLV